MQITVRAYQPSDLPAMIRIWNEVVEDGIAFPQEHFLDEQTGAEFFAKQTYSAVAEVDDKVLGLDSGANYYLTKPFDAKELLAAVRAITRKSAEVDTKLTCGNIVLDRSSFELSSPSGSMRLANKEFQMLEMLMSNPKNIISVDTFMDHIWGYDTDTESNVVWVYVSYLRKKLAALDANVKIKATRNAGYSLEIEE